VFPRELEHFLKGSSLFLKKIGFSLDNNHVLREKKLFSLLEYGCSSRQLNSFGSMVVH
jgi:hypothetical protein